jgi:hypothetical protein
MAANPIFARVAAIAEEFDSRRAAETQREDRGMEGMSYLVALNVLEHFSRR